MSQAIGMIELSSIGIGFEVEDAMLKASLVRLLIARTICSGKYVVVVGGEVADVQSSVDAGLHVGQEAVIDHMIIPSVHESVFPALSQSVPLAPNQIGAMGVVETFTVSCILEAADAAAKAADVTLFRIHVAMAVGGKGFLQVTGDVSAVKAAVEAAANIAKRRGALVSRVVIPAPRPELFGEYI